MEKIEEVADKVFALKCEIPDVDTLFTIYLIQEEKGVLIEPGPATLIPAIQNGMKQLGMKELAYVIPTHIHIDHAGGIGSLAKLFPRADIIIHPKGARHVIDPTRLINSTRMAFGDNFEKFYGPILAVPESQVISPEDGGYIPIGGRKLQIIHAPGHAPHHMAIFDSKTAGLFCGEALGLPQPGKALSPIPLAAPPAFDISVYLETIEKLGQLHPRIIFYSHDGTGTDPEQLIPKVAENTKIVGDFIRKALKAGETHEAITIRVREELGMEDVMTVAGYIFYFEKEGLPEGT